MLVTLVSFGVLRYGHLREIIPEQSLSTQPEVLYWYSAYGSFLEISTLLLALLVGICAALFGIIRGSFFKGLAFLVIFVGLVYLGFTILPHYYYSGGDLSSGMFWLTRGFYDYCGTWLFFTILGFIFRHRLEGKVLR
ncbi:MAG: hypothetical protein R6U91_05740 [Bacillota bacterium]